MIFLPFLLFAQYEDVAINLFISASSGLRVRAEPNLNSKIVEVLEYGTRVEIDGRTKEKYTVNGITDYWYYTYKGNDRVWLFSEYLTDRFENEPIVGFWAEEKNLRIGWIFLINGNVSYGLKDAGHQSWGHHKLDKNNYLSIDFNQYRVDELYTYNVTGRIEFINNDKLRLITNNEIKILVRDNRR